MYICALVFNDLCIIGSYFVPRIEKEPPVKLVNTVFPEAVEHKKRIKDGAVAHIAASNFTDLMVWGQKVLLQDIPLLDLPDNCILLNHAPFNSEAYKKWKEELRKYVYEEAPK